jgi:Cu-Zn family superoxide dismutase
VGRHRVDRSWLWAAAAGIGVAGAVATMTGVGAGASEGALHARATLRDAGGTEIGWAKLTEDAAGRVHVNVKVEGLTPGLHGIHIHEIGSCSPTFAAAGGHYNPEGHAHGSHAGDMPTNLVANVAGNGRLNAVAAATISAGDLGVFDGNGSSIVIHADRDDFVSQPAGASGARAACGVLVAG